MSDTRFTADCGERVAVTNTGASECAPARVAGLSRCCALAACPMVIKAKASDVISNGARKAPRWA